MDDKHGEVFRQYDLKVYNMYRARGAFLIETNQGLKLFKSFEGSKNHLIYENRVKNILIENGFSNVDAIVPNKEGELVTQDSSGEKYIVKNWFLGEECNLKSVEEVYEASSNLANMHKAIKVANKLNEEGEIFFQNSLEEVFEKHNRELKRVRGYIKDKKQRNDFELTFLLGFEAFYQEALMATERLKKSEYAALFNHSKEEGAVCHGNYTYHNILVTKSGMAVTNFDKACCGLQLYDLYQFFRKCMEKNDWESEYGKAILRGYKSVLDLSVGEYEVLYILLLYPEKFWKVTNFYFNNKKSWISKRNIQKLKSLQQQSPMKIQFLNEVFSEVL